LGRRKAVRRSVIRKVYKRVEFKRAFEDGDYAFLQCYQRWPGDEDYAGIDIFRFDENGRIVEHWDVLRPSLLSPPNDNGCSERKPAEG
jgi:predicted SnoaL-like aldol condensation-catalyzing enzyme